MSIGNRYLQRATEHLSSGFYFSLSQFIFYLNLTFYLIDLSIALVALAYPGLCRYVRPFLFFSFLFLSYEAFTRMFFLPRNI